jgi:hypothetical protein
MEPTIRQKIELNTDIRKDEQTKNPNPNSIGLSYDPQF